MMMRFVYTYSYVKGFIESSEILDTIPLIWLPYNYYIITPITYVLNHY